MGRKSKEHFDGLSYLKCLNGISGWEIISPFNEKAILHDGPTGLRIDDTARAWHNAPSSSYPSASALACSFDLGVALEAGAAIGHNFSNAKVDVALAPACNIKRSCLCGRNWEYYSEDPYLSGMMAASAVNGLQQAGVGACLKHYLCNNQEYYRHVNESVLSYRALRQIYAKSFEIALDNSKPAAIMSSYNRVNGEYVNASSYLVNDLLRKEFGFDSLLMSDWNAATNNDGSFFAAGLDVEMPFRASALEDYTAGYGKTFSENDLKNRLTEIGRFFSFVKRHRQMAEADDLKGDYATAVRLYEKCAVLAKNEGFFPLSKDDDVLVVGYLAEQPFYVGGGSGATEAAIKKNFLDILNAKGHRYVYIDGYRPGETLDEKSLKELAKSHRKILFFLGSYFGDESEGYDRKDISIHREQLLALAACLSVNPRVGVVVESGSPLDVSLFKDHVKGMFLAYPGGEGMCEALYNLIFGLSNPSGHLAETWPLSLKDNPLYATWHEDPYHSYYDEDIYVGYRYYDTYDIPVAYCFGHGLSYSTFSYEEMKVVPTKGGYEARIKIRNTSDVDGEALALVFASKEKCPLYREKHALVGFAKAFVKAGEEVLVGVKLSKKMFMVYEGKGEPGFIEEGTYTISAGPSVSILPLEAKLELRGKKAKAMPAPEKLERRHYDYEYKFTIDSPAAAFCYVSDYFKRHKDLFRDEGEYQWFIHTEEPVRIIFTHDGFDRDEILRAIEEANASIGGKSFVPLTK